MYNPKIIKEAEAKKIMEEIGVEKAGIIYMMPKTKFRLIKLDKVRNAIANILKQEMLSIGGDVAVNKGCVNCSVQKSDVLLMGTVKQYQRLVEKMKKQVTESKDIAITIEEFLKNLL
ncbi:MAG: hypothetical protein V1831_03095 [Candidatus Woesearchaeota archaeon]